MIPQWHIQVDRILYWDKFARPEVTPKNGTQFDTWWVVPDKARGLKLPAQSADSGQ